MGKTALAICIFGASVSWAQINSGATCFLLYNVDGFAGAYVPDPSRPGLYISDNYYVGDAAVTYSEIRSPGRSDLDMSITCDFRVTERFSLEFLAHDTNALNHAEFGGSIASSGDITQAWVGQT